MATNLGEIVDELSQGDRLGIYKNENDDLFLEVPIGTPEDPDVMTYNIEQIQGELSHVGGE